MVQDDGAAAAAEPPSNTSPHLNAPLNPGGGAPPVAEAAVSKDMARAWNSYSSRLKIILAELKEQDAEWTEEEFRTFMVEYKQNQPSTAQRRIAQLRFMERHSVFPVQLNKGAFQLVQSFWLYIQHRKKVEACNVGALRNDHKAVRALGDFLAVPEAVWPTAPTELMTDERFIPPPEMVHQLLHADYTPNPSTNYANALVKAFLTYDFLIGARCPSEAHTLKLADFSAERHRIVITEPKKTGRRRTLGLDPDWICCSTRRPSLANYTKYWRVKVDPNQKQTAFFLKPDGKPFGSKHGLRKFVCKLVQPKFPWFYPYLGRHWSATARLIDWDFDYNRVADWHGHESVNMTRKHYEHNARLLKQEHGGDWLARAGRARRKTD